MQEGEVALGKDAREGNAGAERDARAGGVDLVSARSQARMTVATATSPSFSARITSVPPPR